MAVEQGSLTVSSGLWFHFYHFAVLPIFDVYIGKTSSV